MPSPDDRPSATCRVGGTGPTPARGGVDRLDPRIPFAGCPFELRTSATRSSIRLRDLSCGGASGLCDEPLNVGSFVTIHFDKEHIVEAQVRWVQLMKIGLVFVRPIAPAFVRRLHRMHGTFVTTRSSG